MENSRVKLLILLPVLSRQCSMGNGSYYCTTLYKSARYSCYAFKIVPYAFCFPLFSIGTRALIHVSIK